MGSRDIQPEAIDGRAIGARVEFDVEARGPASRIAVEVAIDPLVMMDVAVRLVGDFDAESGVTLITEVSV